MKYKLIKYSSPGWTKEFLSERELCAELSQHICDECVRGDFTYFDENGEMVTDENIFPQINTTSDYHDMLSTCCGCEYGVEEVWDAYE
jgi:hypothetical protein